MLAPMRWRGCSVQVMTTSCTHPIRLHSGAMRMSWPTSIMMFGRAWELRLCIGITKSELQFKLDHGPERLFEQHDR